MNRVILMGRLGRDPEGRVVGNGTRVVKFSMATDERVKKGDAWETVPMWHTVVCFGKTGEAAEKHCGKGRRVLIEGRINYREWEGKDGGKQKATEIVADRVQVIDWPDRGGGSAASSEPCALDEDGDVPF